MGPTLLLLTLSIGTTLAAQNIPFLELLNSDSVLQLAQVAAQLSQQGAQQAARNEREIMLRKEAPEVKPITLDQRPSEIFGQTFTNLARPLKMQTLQTVEHPETLFALPSPPVAPKKAVAPPSAVSIDEPVQSAPSSGNIWTEMLRAFGGSALMGVVTTPAPKKERIGEIEIRGAPRVHGDTIYPSFGGTQPITPIAAPEPVVAPQPASQAVAAAVAPENPLMQLANVFLKGPATAPRASAVSTARVDELPIRGAANAPNLPSMKEIVPGATSNFGIPKGKGCLPFLSEFMQIAYGNCVKEADEAAYSSWSQELQSAVLSGKMDLLKASRESCKRGAEREQCNQLRQAISNCDIMDSLQITASLQRNLKRCEEISGIVDQNPVTIMNQIGQLVNGEFTHGFLNNFLG